MTYARITRLIHLFLAIFVTLQLAGGELMDVPGAGEEHEAASIVAKAVAHEAEERVEAGESLLFEVHEYVGLFLVLLVLARWIWGFTWQGNANWRTLFPWLTTEGRRELVDDLRREPADWLRGRLPEPSGHDAIAKTVHGLMILTVTGMAATGLALYFGWNEHGKQTGLIEAIGEVHETLSIMMWVLLGGHVFMALWHQALGHDVLGKMFSLKR